MAGNKLKQCRSGLNILFLQKALNFFYIKNNCSIKGFKKNSQLPFLILKKPLHNTFKPALAETSMKNHALSID